ncbi:MAG: LD-carboxypeptidase [Cardiobacteriaceae bacterium]|nr:LD-carboxypeptidase [Cardiobacteriaceae bacterium]
MKTFIPLPSVQRGDKVAILSPSAGLPGLFPWVHELGLARIRDDFGLVPVEYPTTRQMGSTPADRARDIMAAFADPDIKAVIASIGGNDQIRVLPYLDAALLRANPKPFFGYSDNTHLHHFLWKLGIPSCYGGGVLTQYAMQGQMDAMTRRALEHALFHRGDYVLEASDYYNDEGLPWDNPDNLGKTRKHEANDGHYWDGDADAAGVLWGGCVESLVLQMSAGIYLPGDDELDGAILFLETSEGIPAHWIIKYLLTGMGERGWLAKFRAVLVGRPQAWSFANPQSAEEKAKYRAAQRDAVIETVRRYNAHIPIVQNLDFGHTDPQVPLPLGGLARLEGKARRIILHYA